MFFVWVGASFLLDVDWCVAWLGVGILAPAIQGLRRGLGVDFKGFWVLLGSVILAGVLELGTIDGPLLPILLMTSGVLVLVSAIRKTQD